MLFFYWLQPVPCTCLCNQVVVRILQKGQRKTISGKNIHYCECRLLIRSAHVIFMHSMRFWKDLAEVLAPKESGGGRVWDIISLSPSLSDEDFYFIRSHTYTQSVNDTRAVFLLLCGFLNAFTTLYWKRVDVPGNVPYMELILLYWSSLLRIFIGLIAER